VQTADVHATAASDLKVVTRRTPTPAQVDDLLFAWRVAKHVKSNAIVYCAEGRTLGIGAGQMSRVDSTRIAAIRRRTPSCRLPGRWSPRTRSSRSATASTWWPTMAPWR